MKRIKPVTANAGVRALLRQRLTKQLRALHKSVLWQVARLCRDYRGPLAHDEELHTVGQVVSRFDQQCQRWLTRWDVFAKALTGRFVRNNAAAVKSSVWAAYKSAGMTVKLPRQSAAMRDALTALAAENVGLIKTIPRNYLGQVKQTVLQSLTHGGDVYALRREIARLYKVSDRRAYVIARDQTQKASQAMQRIEDQAVGITYGEWVHIPGRKESRMTHKAMNGKVFRLDRGLYDPDEKKRVLPGECICCCCTYYRLDPEDLKEQQELERKCE